MTGYLTQSISLLASAFFLYIKTFLLFPRRGSDTFTDLQDKNNLGGTQMCVWNER